jgi:hypothetical protein
MLDEVATDGPADLARLGFLGSVCDNIAEIGGFAAGWNLVVANELDGVGAFGLFVSIS